MPKRTIVRGAAVVTMDDALGDFSSADILIEDGAIAAVGPSLEAAGAEAIDGSGMIALPGIVDAHTCLWQTVLRGHVPDLWQGTYNTALLPLRRRYCAEDNFNAAYVGSFEMLSYGTTTVVDYCHNIRAPGYAEASLEALKTTGIRHLFTYSFMSAHPDDFPGSPSRFDDARAVYDRYHDPAGLTDIGFGVDSIGGAGLEKQLAFARSLKAPSCIHVNETGTIDKLHAAGLLGPDLLVIHGNLITNSELELMAKARMPICFTPSADVQGTPADVVRRAADRGVEVVFGCDIPCSVASDTLGQLRIMFNVQGFLDGAMERSFSTVIGRRPPVRPGVPLLTPRRLIETATIGAARVLGLDDRIGSLTPGKRADLVLIRKGPFGDSVARDACAHVLLQTSPREVDTVIVDGKVRMKGGVLAGFDPDRAAAMIRSSRGRILGEKGATRP
ncbi:MAG: amidohydrolase family protein [Reyranellales bacterium]